MSLSLADPAGPRGVYYLFRDYGITIDGVQPTPGFNAGPVRPGEWLIEIDTYRLLPPDDITYVIDVELSSGPDDRRPVVYEKPARSARGPGWYRGDLHSHSLHSDASWDVPDLVAMGFPKKSLVVVGQRDALFPPAGVDESFRQIGDAYRRFGHPEYLSLKRPDKPHCYDCEVQQLALDWFAKWLT